MSKFVAVSQADITMFINPKHVSFITTKDMRLDVHLSSGKQLIITFENEASVDKLVRELDEGS